MYVTTNLPVMKKWTGDLTFVPLDTSKRPVVVSFSISDTLRDIEFASPVS